MNLPPRWTIFLLLVMVFALVIRENRTRRPAELQQLASGQVEMCLDCHRQEKLDPAHDVSILGCASCHLGNALAAGKEAAHQGIVRNPGDLRVVEKTCGVSDCHPQDVVKVKNSLMATNRGILATLRYYWGEAPDQNGDYSVEKLLASGETSLAIDYYRKLCATCHLWKQKGDLPGFFGEKGGGCSACHHVDPRPDGGRKITESALPADGRPGKKPHPLISKKVPSENCVRCHNRSGRTGISFLGIYESEGYGTPYEQGGFSGKVLPGDRFYQELPPDIHHQKGMACIDCHTREEIMGDGKRHAHYEQALEVGCASCHTSGTPGLTSRKRELNNFRREKDGAVVLVGKLDNRPHPLKPPRPGSCDYPGHRRVSCEACHSPWVPQCYGCHVKQDRRETHLDKLTLEETPGWWEEGRSYLRYERPMLAVWNDEIVIVTPGCQDIVTLIDEKGGQAGAFNSLTMAALSPHTTQRTARSCQDCHATPKTLGLGEGTAWLADGTWNFTPAAQGVATEAGLTPPLDGYVDINGTPLQKSARPELRPFNRQELSGILRVGRCIECHQHYNNPLYRNYSPQTSCPVFKE